MEHPVIEVDGVSFRYGTRAALKNISFSVEASEIFALLGPNGGGKTTLFRILTMLLPPTQGHARILGEDLNRHPLAVRQRIGVVFQAPSLDRKLTVRENLRHQGHLYGLHGGRLTERIVELLARFGLAERAEDRVEQLSGGLCRRVELAKSFLHGPTVLLLDEPSTGLDPIARREFWGYLKSLQADEHVTILLTTHFMEEAERSDRLAILDQGQLVALGAPDTLKQNIGGDVVMLESREPDELRSQIESRFGGHPTVLDGMVRIERPRGHEFIAEVMEAFPGLIEAVTLSKPTLEDVFIRQTGHRFHEGRP